MRRPARIPPQRPRPTVALYHRTLWSTITEYPDGLMAVRFFTHGEARAYYDDQRAAGRLCRLLPPATVENGVVMLR